MLRFSMGLHMFSFHTFGIIHVLLMHAWILNGLPLLSIHTFGIIHVPYCMVRY